MNKNVLFSSAGACALLLFFLNAIAYGEAAKDEGREDRPPLAALLPGDSDLSGWRKSAGPETFVPENLWEYIDGQAQMYVDYGFRRAASAEYAARDAPGRMTVEIYEMASPKHAFGIYAAERSPEDAPVQFEGVEGSLGENGLNFWKGLCYVRLISYGDAPGKKEAFKTFGAVVCGKIKGPRQEPALFSAFPREGRVKGSERFIPKNFLGQSYLQEGYRVDYRVEDGRAYQVFLADSGSYEEAGKAFEQYRAFLESQHEAVVPKAALEGVRCFSAGGHELVFQTGPYLGGVLGRQDGDAAASVAKKLIRNLEKSNP